jgi:hypothetical protein
MHVALTSRGGRGARQLARCKATLPWSQGKRASIDSFESSFLVETCFPVVWGCKAGLAFVRERSGCRLLERTIDDAKVGTHVIIKVSSRSA